MSVSVLLRYASSVMVAGSPWLVRSRRLAIGRLSLDELLNTNSTLAALERAGIQGQGQGRPDVSIQSFALPGTGTGRGRVQGRGRGRHPAALPQDLRIVDGAPRPRPALLRQAGEDPVPGRPPFLPDERTAARLPDVRGAHDASHSVRGHPAPDGCHVRRQSRLLPREHAPGTACQRVPLPGTKYCPPHKHLGEVVAEVVAA